MREGSGPAAVSGTNRYDARLIIAASETDANLYYATRFIAPDPFIFLQVDGEKILLMSDLEVDRARKQARVDTVLSLSEYERRARASGDESTLGAVAELLRERGLKKVLVPGNFPIEYADRLRGRGFELGFKAGAFFEERICKTAEEIEAIRQTQRATEQAVEAAIRILRESDIKGDRLIWKGQVVTSELIKQVINVKLMELGCVAQHTIVASDLQACDPHDEGSGPLLPHRAIVMDVFPQSIGSRYYADMTRTVVRGKASEDLKRMYDTVLEGQELGIERVRAGARGAEIHGAICDLFEKRGYKTGLIEGRMQGFFHGTGHGVGIEIHEPPRISKADNVLARGQVVTVEPGLYYPRIGGVRIEDLVVVTENGCENLTRFPKFLEV